MKKKILALMMSLVMTFALAACGGETDSENSSAPEQTESTTVEESSEVPESTEDTVESTETTEDTDTTEETTALTDWYNSENRTVLETTINDMFASQGLSFFVTIEEPGTIIYNYQYTEQMEITSEATEQLDASLDSGANAIIADIAAYKTTYNLPLEVIRMTYLNADGTEFFSKDFAEDYAP